LGDKPLYSPILHIIYICTFTHIYTYIQIYIQVIIGGQTFLLSGTSASAPVVAGMFSLINAQRLAIGKPSLGFVSPALYDGYKNFVKDITSGFNNCPAGRPDAQCCTQGFYATPGWDPPSGLGSPDFQRMKKYFMDLVTNPTITYTVLQVCTVHMHVYYMYIYYVYFDKETPPPFSLNLLPTFNPPFHNLYRQSLLMP
jgi:subtilase family serine protease